MAELTLADHAEAWWLEKGNTIPPRDSDEWKKMYEAWVEWAFSDLRGDEQGKRKRKRP